jgi:DNA-3-methyladenine glycosylase
VPPKGMSAPEAVRRGQRRGARRDRPLPHGFYARPAPEVARALLGCVLVSRIDGRLTAGRIVETEAYLGPEDPASHAAFRPSAYPFFYGPGGHAYVFRAYGLHFCLNAITNPPGTPGCVLIRALEPTRGHITMAARRGISAEALTLTNGPAKVTQAVGVTLRENGVDLSRGRLTIEHGPTPSRFAVGIGPRVGITRARGLRLRFWIRGNPYVSPARPRGD